MTYIVALWEVSLGSIKLSFSTPKPPPQPWFLDLHGEQVWTVLLGPESKKSLIVCEEQNWSQTSSFPGHWTQAAVSPQALVTGYFPNTLKCYFVKLKTNNKVLKRVLLLYFIVFSFGATPDVALGHSQLSTQESHLVDSGTRWDAGDWTWASHVLGEHLTCSTISLASEKGPFKSTGWLCKAVTISKWSFSLNLLWDQWSSPWAVVLLCWIVPLGIVGGKRPFSQVETWNNNHQTTDKLQVV